MPPFLKEIPHNTAAHEMLKKATVNLNEVFQSRTEDED